LPVVDIVPSEFSSLISVLLPGVKSARPLKHGLNYATGRKSS
jgi:hypothetical protein